jgi:hypothetical protein
VRPVSLVSFLTFAAGLFLGGCAAPNFKPKQNFDRINLCPQFSSQENIKLSKELEDALYQVRDRHPGFVDTVACGDTSLPTLKVAVGKTDLVDLGEIITASGVTAAGIAISPILWLNGIYGAIFWLDFPNNLTEVEYDFDDRFETADIRLRRNSESSSWSRDTAANILLQKNAFLARTDLVVNHLKLSSSFDYERARRIERRQASLAVEQAEADRLYRYMEAGGSIALGINHVWYGGATDAWIANHGGGRLYADFIVKNWVVAGSFSPWTVKPRKDLVVGTDTVYRYLKVNPVKLNLALGYIFDIRGLFQVEPAIGYTNAIFSAIDAAKKLNKNIDIPSSGGLLLELNLTRRLFGTKARFFGVRMGGAVGLVDFSGTHASLGSNYYSLSATLIFRGTGRIISGTKETPTKRPDR